MAFNEATLVPDEQEPLDDAIARTEADLQALSDKLQRLIQLRELRTDTEAAKELLDNLASEMTAQKRYHDQIFASLEVLKGQLPEA